MVFSKIISERESNGVKIYGNQQTFQIANFLSSLVDTCRYTVQKVIYDFSEKLDVANITKCFHVKIL